MGCQSSQELPKRKGRKVQIVWWCCLRLFLYLPVPGGRNWVPARVWVISVPQLWWCSLWAAFRVRVTSQWDGDTWDPVLAGVMRFLSTITALWPWGGRQRAERRRRHCLQCGGSDGDNWKWGVFPYKLLNLKINLSFPCPLQGNQTFPCTGPRSCLPLVSVALQEHRDGWRDVPEEPHLSLLLVLQLWIFCLLLLLG